MIELAAHYSFGLQGTARAHMREGWSHREPDFTWTEGTRSRIVLPYVAGDGQMVLEIGVNPLLFPPVLRQQRLLISVNGHDVADEVLLGECALGVEVPEHALNGAEFLDIHLACPTASVPVDISMSADDRRLGVAVREMLVFRTPPRAAFQPRLRPPLQDGPGGIEGVVRGVTGLGLPELAACFTSIGHNCEFGLVQRDMGAEALGLLRFAGIPMRRLIEGLDLGFEGLEEPGNLLTYLHEVTAEGQASQQEFMVRDRRYETNYHTDMMQSQTNAETVLQKYHRHLGFLRRGLIEDLASGHKIFVFQHPAARSIVQVRAISNLLRSHGPNTLLFVTDDHSQPPGSVEQIEDDLLHGRTSRLAPVDDVTNFDLPAWISICANAYRLWRQSGRGGA